MNKVTSGAVASFNDVNVTLLGKEQDPPHSHHQHPPPHFHQDPTLHAEDCDHTGAVKLGRTSIMEIKILNDDGRELSRYVVEV